jgi:hypothetical protein
VVKEVNTLKKTAMKYSLINAVSVQDFGTTDGYWIQNHVGTIETATEKAKAYIDANKSGNPTVVIVKEITGTRPALSGLIKGLHALKVIRAENKTMIEAKHIKTDGTTEIVPQLEGGTFTLQELQDYVGGYIELVQLGNGTVMVVNEEGLIKNLPFNLEASKIASIDIVGNVLVCDVSMID